MHFAPTERARQNLLSEGVSEHTIFVTGNTIVDAWGSVGDAFDDHRLAGIGGNGHRLLLVTAHRRENHGRPLRSICKALRVIIEAFDDVEVVYPVHLNPRIGQLVREELGRVY